ncbi:hypothetical protein [Dulcicalothrix desertica]|nr:hypothetical protein [Dulcicalothrix desertica]TWH39742.1 hypothetical protein CAL7102_09001 [Dulcicalothrix desertica PCC 7102]
MLLKEISKYIINIISAVRYFVGADLTASKLAVTRFPINKSVIDISKNT